MLCVLSSASACVTASRCRCPMRFFVRYRRRCLRCCAQSTLLLLLPGASASAYALFFFSTNSVEFLRLQSSNATKAPNRTRSAVAASACDCDTFPFTFPFASPFLVPRSRSRSRSRYCSPVSWPTSRSVLSDSAGSEDQSQWGKSRSDAADRQISLRIHTICTIYTHTHSHTHM